MTSLDHVHGKCCYCGSNLTEEDKSNFCVKGCAAPFDDELKREEQQILEELHEAKVRRSK